MNMDTFCTRCGGDLDTGLYCTRCGARPDAVYGPQDNASQLGHLDALGKHIARLEAENAALRGRVKVLEEASEEVLTVADLRGDTDLPHPADDPKTWTGRMAEAWDALRASLAEGTLADGEKGEKEKA
jgi:hypothetical protein